MITAWSITPPLDLDDDDRSTLTTWVKTPSEVLRRPNMRAISGAGTSSRLTRVDGHAIGPPTAKRWVHLAAKR
jgi:hypothetical protein